jgi:YVTN family beta-propeller protein
MWSGLSRGGVRILRSHIIAITVSVLLAPSFVSAGTIFTADEGQNTVSMFDSERGLVTTIGVSVTPHNVDLTPNGHTLLVAGVTAHGTGQHRQGALVLIDAAGPLPIVMAEIAVGQHPAHVVPSADGARAFVTDAAANAVHAVDLESRTIVGRVAVGSYPHGLRLSPDGRILAVANIRDGTVSIIDAEKLIEKRRIRVGRSPVQVGFTPDGRTLLVTLNGEDRLAFVDLRSNRTVRKVGVGRKPVQVYATADGKRALVANQGPARRPDNRVTIVTLDGTQPARHIVSGAGAHGVALSRDGVFAFVTNTVANTVSVIDVERATVLRSWPTGKEPNGVVAF